MWKLGRNEMILNYITYQLFEIPGISNGETEIVTSNVAFAFFSKRLFF